ncbi:MAG: hypothetical protein QXI09_02785 [Candidatus Aenigmatarchaeota archaeon]
MGLFDRFRRKKPQEEQRGVEKVQPQPPQPIKPSKKETGEEYIRYTPEGILDLVDKLLDLSREELERKLKEYTDKKGKAPLSLVLAYSIKRGDIYLSAARAARIEGTDIKIDKEKLQLVYKKDNKSAKNALENLAALCSIGEVYDVMRKLSDIIYKHWEKGREAKSKEVPSEERTGAYEVSLTREEAKKESLRKEGAVPTQTYSVKQDALNQLSSLLYSSMKEERGKVIEELKALIKEGKLGATRFEKSFVYRDDKSSEVMKTLINWLPEGEKEEIMKKLWGLVRSYEIASRGLGDKVEISKQLYKFLDEVKEKLYEKASEEGRKLAEAFVELVEKKEISTTKYGIARSLYSSKAEEIYKTIRKYLSKDEDKDKLYQIVRMVEGKPYSKQASNLTKTTILVILAALSPFLLVLFFLPSVSGFIVRSSLSIFTILLTSILIFTIIFKLKYQKRRS